MPQRGSRFLSLNTSQVVTKALLSGGSFGDMDQDVEAILNAPDSEDDDNVNVQGVSLEDILREDDGGEGYLVDGDGGGIESLRGDTPHLGRCEVNPSLHIEYDSPFSSTPSAIGILSSFHPRSCASFAPNGRVAK